MQKILFSICLIWTFNLKASLCDNFSDLRSFDSQEDAHSPLRQKSKSYHTEEQLKKLIHEFINNNNSFGLDSLLNKISPEIKKTILNKQFSVTSQNGKSFVTDFINLAVESKNCDIIKTLIKHGATFNSSCSDGYNALTRAAETNSSNIIKTLVSFGLNINSYDANGNTALIIAVQNSLINLIPFLKTIGADINFKSSDGFTPLCLAIDYNNKLMTCELLKSGADIKLSGNDGFSPLNRAISKNLPQIIDLLIKYGANINECDQNGNTPLKIAIFRSHTTLIPILIRLGANVNLISNGFTPLCSAVDNNDKLMIEELIKYGADIELAGNDGFSPLTRAIDQNLLQITELLIKFGAKINKPDKNGNTALSIAIRNSYTNIATQLIQLGAYIDKQNENEDPPLINALIKNNQQLAEILLSKNINPNLQDSKGNAALHIAIENSYDKIIPLLIKKGADPYLKNDNYINPILLAASYEKKDITKILLSNNSPSIDILNKALVENDIEAFKLLLELCKTNPFINDKDNISIAYRSLISGNQEIFEICHQHKPSLLEYKIYNYPPLHLAVMYGHNKLVKHLVEKCNANINSLDYYGATPIHYAAAYGNHEAAEYLITKRCQLNNQIQKDFDYPKGSTPLDLAIQFAHSDVINLLSKQKAKTHTTKKSSNLSNLLLPLAIFIDQKVEFSHPTKKLISVNTALSEDIRDLINQKACSIIIIGQHLLNNALKLSCSLEDWLIIEIAQENHKQKGYIIIPNKIINTFLNSDDTAIEDTLQRIGFDFSHIEHNYVSQEYVMNKNSTIETPDKKEFSDWTTNIIEKLLTPTNRMIYWDGHGFSKGDNPSIGGLSKNNAEKLFDIFANKKTNFVYVNSCFFGGNNLNTIKNFKDMVIISSATTEIATQGRLVTKPANWRGFFDIISSCPKYPSAQTYCSFLSQKVLPLITTQSPHISNFPHIKLTGNTKFTLLAINEEALLIDEKLINTSSKASIPLNKQRLIELNTPQIQNSIIIKDKIPLIISNHFKNVFTKIHVNMNNNLIDILKKLSKPYLFQDSTLENTFLIKELSCSREFSLNLNKEKIILPKILYNVLIQRGPSCKCSIFFSKDKISKYQNSIGLDYDFSTKTWKTFLTLTTEEFALYQQLIKLTISGNLF